MSEKSRLDLLVENYKPILNHPKFAPIQDDFRMKVTAQLLENQTAFLAEQSRGLMNENTTTGNMATWEPVLMSMVRRLAPKLIAYDICGVQPMDKPVGVVFALRARYNDKNGNEALFHEADTAFGGTGTHAGNNPFLALGGVANITMDAQGSGYTSMPTATVIGGGGQGATVMPVLGTKPNDVGKIVSCVVTNAGYGYTSAPTVAFTGGGGSGANAIANLGVPSNAFSTGSGMATGAAEAGNFGVMSTTIEKQTVEAKERQLRAEYSYELAQDLRAIHGLDANTELSNILSSEIIAEVNRELVRLIYSVAKPGAQFSTTPGTYDLIADSDGRWFVERFKALMFAIERDANAISIDTKRGKGNIIITTSDIASALAMTGVLNFAPALQGTVDMEVDATGTTYAGTMGRFKVFIDPYLSSDGYVVGFKGSNQYDAGVFYAPYVPLQIINTINPTTLQPIMGFKTRYGLVSNPFTSLHANQNSYYRKVKVENIL